MHRLQVVNFQKCIDVLEDFVQATPASMFDDSLKEKKKQAEQSLDQMKELFITPVLESDSDARVGDCTNHDCNTGTCKQQTS